MNRDVFGKVWNKAKGALVKLAFAAAVLLGLAGATQPASAALDDVVSYATGVVTFTPSEVVTPVITGLIAAIGAAAAVFVIVVGIRWIYRMAKGAK